MHVEFDGVAVTVKGVEVVIVVLEQGDICARRDKICFSTGISGHMT